MWGFDPVNLPGAQPRLFNEPTRTGKLNGFPVYRVESGDEIFVLSRAGKVPWAVVPFMGARHAVPQGAEASAPRRSP